MERELEEQIDDIIQKANKDLKSRIVRIVSRHQSKLLKEQARELKSGGGATTSRKFTTTSSTSGRGKPVVSSTAKSSKTKKDSKYHSDSDSEGYYSA
jgi:hypothetical protein